MYSQITLFLAQTQPEGFGGLGSLPVLLLMLAGFWFLLIAPQRKRQKQQEQMISSLSKGDEVLTACGIYGSIAQVKEDRFIIKVSDAVQLEFSRSAIQTKINPEKPKK